MANLKINCVGNCHPWLGVFETVCVRKGRPLFLEEHWQSLQRACAALNLKRPLDFRGLAHVLPKADGRWRWVIGPAGPSHSFQHEKPIRGAAFTLTTASVRVGSVNLDARHKTLSYLSHWQARSENPTGEALLLNEKGHIASGAMSNIFWVRRGRVFTPDVSSGCRAGVVRGWVLEEVGARFARSRPSALDSSEEIFVTNSMLGVRPVSRWQDRKLKAGPVSRLLQRRYARLIGAM